MIWYLRAGRIKENVTGRGARGYTIFRKGNSVYRIWGGVDIINREMVWRKGWPRYQEDQFDSGDDAIRFVETILKRKMRYKDTPYVIFYETEEI
jgi:hypothetical protein